MTSGVDYDDSRWPLVRVTMPACRVAGAALDEHLARIARYYERGEHFGLLFDLRRTGMAAAEDRRRIAASMEEDADRYPGLMTGCAVVLASALHRNVIKSLSWMVRPGYPIGVFTEVTEAERWLEARLATAEPHRVARG